MKKLFSLAVLLIIAIGIISVPVYADGGDFLLRGNKWGISSSEIKETGTYTGKTHEYDLQKHTWTSENYSSLINGDSYRVRYDFNDKDHLFVLDMKQLPKNTIAIPSLNMLKKCIKILSVNMVTLKIK